jgi:uncharacterized protein YjbI with pentapeptide repeats
MPHNSERMEDDHRIEQGQQPSKQTAGWERSLGDRLLRTFRTDPDKWTIGDRRLAFLAIVIGQAIVIIAVCGYIFDEWEWTGLTKPHQRTFWDWLSLLIVPIVLALGGYLFTRSEARRAQDLANQRAQDEALQAYLDGMAQLLTDKDRPLHRAPLGDSLRTVARARTLTVLGRLDSARKGSVVRFLYEADLITKGRRILDLQQADLSEVILSGAYLRKSDLSYANLREANLSGADLRKANLDCANLSDTNLSYANLSSTLLNQAKMRNTNVRNAILGEANLSGADLREFDLREAYLSYANLRQADLRGADLKEADLSNATLSGADLRSSGLSNTNLRRADLREADLSYANLREADLTDALVTHEQLTQARFLEGATMPDGQKYEDWLKSKGRGEHGENSGPS